MKVILQRCLDASVTVNNKCVGKIDKGLMLLIGFTENDSTKEIDYMIDKIINLRIFDDDNGVMNKSLIDINGSILSISQFTLYADSKKGRRPSKLKEELTKLNETSKVEEGIFGADMKVKFTNDGPVTIILEKEGDNNG